MSTYIDRLKQRDADIAVEVAEDRLSAYHREHYGPLWGHTNEDAAAQLRAELVAAYELAGTPADDRREDV